MFNYLEKIKEAVTSEIIKRGRLKHVFKNKLTNSGKDDFNWKHYNDHYQEELRVIQRIYSLKLSEGDYVFEKGSLARSKEILPLHHNHRLLYETICLLSPLSVAEVGCGGGDHLYNLSVLMPETKLIGYDRSLEQISFALERSPNLRDKLYEFDMTMPFSDELKISDIAYTQAVIMHIKTGNGHLVALSNIFKIAAKQVVLMENWTQHSFFDDIKLLFKKKMIPWKQIFFYFRRAPENKNKPHLMVVSSTPLSLEPLESYSQLLCL